MAYLMASIFNGFYLGLSLGMAYLWKAKPYIHPAIIDLLAPLHHSLMKAGTY
jgi:hypothetical protein|uniref:Uncharacterized protein n=1 Tax=Picea sitchensis TaxID=3332 RepID=A0A6B9XTA5_PICSI|nr:hypothetical protein Q903MT_gene4291 [Picea sitchensis]